MENGKKLSFFIKNKKQFALLIFAAVFGASMLAFGAGSDGKNASGTQINREGEDIIKYCEATEEKIKILCENIERVSDVHVIVSLEGGFETVYALDDKYLTVGSGSSESAVPIKTNTPKVKGIGIVCRGGEDPSVQKEICLLLGAAFDIPISRIYVVGGT